MATTNTQQDTRSPMQIKIGNFYDQFQKLIADMPTGVRFQIAESMLSDVSYTMHRYRNELSKEVMDVLDEVADLRKKYRENALKNANRGRAEMTTPQSSTSADGGKVA